MGCEGSSNGILKSKSGLIANTLPGRCMAQKGPESDCLTMRIPNQVCNDNLYKHTMYKVEI